MKLTGNESREIVNEDHEDYVVISDEITGKTRWADCHTVVVRNKKTDCYYETTYRTGSTENCDEMPFEFEENVEWVEVVPVQVMTTVFKRRKASKTSEPEPPKHSAPGEDSSL